MSEKEFELESPSVEESIDVENYSEEIGEHDLDNMFRRLMKDGYLKESQIADVLIEMDHGTWWHLAFSKVTGVFPKRLIEIYNEIKIDLREGQKIIGVGNGWFAADREMVILLEELNKFGFKTCQHCAGHEIGVDEWGDLQPGVEEEDVVNIMPYLSFDLDAVDVKVFNGRVSIYVKDESGESQI